jgi:hypothetical protein
VWALPPAFPAAAGGQHSSSSIVREGLEKFETIEKTNERKLIGVMSVRLVTLLEQLC